MTVEYLKPRRYVDSDLDKIGELMAAHFEISEVPRRKLVFDWVAGHNPAANGEVCYLVIEDKGTLAAYQGRMPVDLMVNGKKERGYFLHDLLVHPEYRKKGLGVFLVNLMMRDWEETTDTFTVGIWMNEISQGILRKRGYPETNVNYYVKPINPESILKNIVKNNILARFLALQARGLTKIYDTIMGYYHYRGSHIFRIPRFDQRFDDFALRISKKFSLIVLRNSEYLNWRYVDMPFADFSIYGVERDNELTGYIVLKRIEVEGINVGVIVDILAAPDDSRTINILCQQAIRHFKGERVDYISCILTSNKFIKIFKRNLFFARRKTVPVMMGNLNKHSEQELIKNIDNWYLTYGDSDGFMWQ